MSVADLCREYGVSRPTGYRWIDRCKARLETLQPDVAWPAANILSRAGLTSPQKKRKGTTPCSEPFSMVTGPNQLWYMDFKGYFITGDGKRCDPFTITDAYSRYLIRCQIVSRMDLRQWGRFVKSRCGSTVCPHGSEPTTAFPLKVRDSLNYRSFRLAG